MKKEEEGTLRARKEPYRCEKKRRKRLKAPKPIPPRQKSFTHSPQHRISGVSFTHFKAGAILRKDYLVILMVRSE